jgi:hypothetical protein
MSVKEGNKEGSDLSWFRILTKVERVAMGRQVRHSSAGRNPGLASSDDGRDRLDPGLRRGDEISLS